MKQGAIWVRPFYYLVVFTVATISLYPILLMILSSFKKSVDIYKNPLGLPTSFSLDTYRTLLAKIPFTTYFLNSLFVSIVSVILIVVVCSLVAFYIARFKFSWNHALFFIFY